MIDKYTDNINHKKTHDIPLHINKEKLVESVKTCRAYRNLKKLQAVIEGCDICGKDIA